MPGPLPKYPSTFTPEQEARLQHLSTCSTAPFAEVQRARLLLLAHHHPDWRHADIARQGGGTPETIRPWRRRWQTPEVLHDAPRAGTRRTCTPLQRAQITALACRAPRAHGQAWQRWSAEKLAQGADSSLAATGQAQTLAVSRVAALDRSAVCGAGSPGPRPLRTRAGGGGTGRSGGVQ
jgi:hypothetical protein